MAIDDSENKALLNEEEEESKSGMEAEPQRYAKEVVVALKEVVRRNFGIKRCGFDWRYVSSNSVRAISMPRKTYSACNPSDSILSCVVSADRRMYVGGVKRATRETCYGM